MFSFWVKCKFIKTYKSDIRSISNNQEINHYGMKNIETKEFSRYCIFENTQQCFIDLGLQIIGFLIHKDILFDKQSRLIYFQGQTYDISDLKIAENLIFLNDVIVGTYEVSKSSIFFLDLNFNANESMLKKPFSRIIFFWKGAVFDYFNKIAVDNAIHGMTTHLQNILQCKVLTSLNEEINFDTDNFADCIIDNDQCFVINKNLNKQLRTSQVSNNLANIFFAYPVCLSNFTGVFYHEPTNMILDFKNQIMFVLPRNFSVICHVHQYYIVDENMNSNINIDYTNKNINNIKIHCFQDISKSFFKYYNNCIYWENLDNPDKYYIVAQNTDIHSIKKVDLFTESKQSLQFLECNSNAFGVYKFRFKTPIALWDFVISKEKSKISNINKKIDLLNEKSLEIEHLLRESSMAHSAILNQNIIIGRTTTQLMEHVNHLDGNLINNKVYKDISERCQEILDIICNKNCYTSIEFQDLIGQNANKILDSIRLLPKKYEEMKQKILLSFDRINEALILDESCIIWEENTNAILYEVNQIKSLIRHIENKQTIDQKMQEMKKELLKAIDSIKVNDKKIEEKIQYMKDDIMGAIESIEEKSNNSDIRDKIIKIEKNTESIPMLFSKLEKSLQEKYEIIKLKIHELLSLRNLSKESTESAIKLITEIENFQKVGDNSMLHKIFQRENELFNTKSTIFKESRNISEIFSKFDEIRFLINQSMAYAQTNRTISDIEKQNHSNQETILLIKKDTETTRDLITDNGTRKYLLYTAFVVSITGPLYLGLLVFLSGYYSNLQLIIVPYLILFISYTFFFIYLFLNKSNSELRFQLFVFCFMLFFIILLPFMYNRFIIFAMILLLTISNIICIAKVCSADYIYWILGSLTFIFIILIALGHSNKYKFELPQQIL